MERLTTWNDKTESAELISWNEEEWKDFMGSLDVPICTELSLAVNKLAEYEDAEEQGLLLRLPIGQDRSDLIYILARLLMHTEFGKCYLCTNPMKNITLDEKNNGCDGNCRVDEKFDEDDLITMIIKELQTKEEAKQALVKMKEGVIWKE